MKTFFFSLLVLASAAAHAQNYSIDSLQKILQTEKEDTNKVNILNTLSKVYWSRNQNSSDALKYASEAFQVSEKLGYKKGNADAYFNISQSYLLESKFPESLQNLFSALKLYEQLGVKTETTKTLQAIGATYGYHSEPGEALEYLQQALKLRTEIGNKSDIAQTLNSIGQVFFSQGKYSQAYENYSVALRIYKNLGDSAPEWGLPFTYGNIANIYESQGDSERLKGDEIGAENKYSEARKGYIETLSLWEKIKEKDGIATAYLWLGNIHVKLKRFQVAKEYYQKCLTVSTAIKMNRIITGCYLQLYNVENSQGNYKQALEHYKIYILYRDSLVNEESTKKATQAQMQYEFDKKEDSTKAAQDKIDAVSKAEIENQKLIQNFTYAGAATVLGFAGIGFYRFRKRRKLQSQQEMLNERLRISRELHDDIGSTLGSISIYSEVARNRAERNEDSNEALTKIGIASRELIDKMSDIVWSINPNNETFEQLQNRMSAFAAMMLTPQNISFEFKTDEELKTLQLTNEERKNIFLIYKEAIHNIVKYAACKNVFISLTGSNDNLHLVIKDDGIGFDFLSFEEGQGEAYNGNGIKNMKARAKDISAQLSISSKMNEGSNIELTLSI